MDLKELKKLSDNELHSRLAELRQKVREFRFSIANSQLKNLREIRQSKKEIAQVLTTINSRRQNSTLSGKMESEK